MNKTTSFIIPALFAVAPVYATDYLSIEQAQRIIFPTGDEIFVEQDIALSAQQRKQIKKQAGVRQRAKVQPAWQVLQNGKSAGWFLTDEVIGKHEFITYAVGISNSGEVIGVEVLSYRETHGGEVREKSWRDHFKGKHLGDPFKLDVDVPNISGATLSSRNLLDGVKRLLVLHQLFLQPRVASAS